MTSIRIDQDVLRTAKELGLSVSKVSENALKEAIKRLQTPVQQTETNGGYIDMRSVSRSALKWTGRDLNPRPPECKSGVHARLNYRPTRKHEHKR